MQEGFQMLPDSIRKTIHVEQDIENVVDTEIIEDNLEVSPENSQNLLSEVCCCCDKECSNSYQCKKCKRFLHLECQESEDGHGTICNLCLNQENITKNQNSAYQGLTAQAEKMVKLSNKKFPPLDVGTSVKIPIPNLDRGKNDQKNVIGVVTERTPDDLYRIATPEGELNSLFARNMIHACKHNFLNIDVMGKDIVSLRTVSQDSVKIWRPGIRQMQLYDKLCNKQMQM